MPDSESLIDGGAIVIDRCVCANMTFAELSARQARTDCSLEELAAALGCGRGCTMCLPYLRRMARTGQTRFHEIISEIDEPAATPSRNADDAAAIS